MPTKRPKLELIGAALRGAAEVARHRLSKLFTKKSDAPRAFAYLVLDPAAHSVSGYARVPPPAKLGPLVSVVVLHRFRHTNRDVWALYVPPNLKKAADALQPPPLSAAELADAIPAPRADAWAHRFAGPLGTYAAPPAWVLESVRRAEIVARDDDDAWARLV